LDLSDRLQRAEITTTLVTTNLIPSNWGKIFDTATRFGDLGSPQYEW
jgi:hypothetical protein